MPSDGPADETTDEAVDETVDETLEDADDDTWVFGYGSLVSPESLARTIGRTAVLGVDFHEAQLRGYGRRWNYGVATIAGSWITADGARIDDGVIVALGIIAATDETTSGVIARVSTDDLRQLDRREREYDRVDVTEQITLVAADGRPVGDNGRRVRGRVVTYVPRASAIDAYERGRDSGRAGIRSTYWTLVDEAFAALGADRRERYRTSTPTPDIPVVELLETRAVRFQR